MIFCALIKWGSEYATDIAEAFPDKPVTLLHSRKQLLPKFDVKMHEQGTSVCLHLVITPDHIAE